MNSNDIFRKSDLGLEEIKDQTLGVLPREARTLLILIDGKKSYQRYLDTLNNSKMFAASGGITPLLQMLYDLQYIELVGATNDKASETSSTSQSVTPPTVSAHQVSPSASNEARQPTKTNGEAEFAAQFDGTRVNQASNKSNESSADYETIKSDLASYIEKNAPSQDAWGYLLSLEQCENDSHLLALVQRIQKSTSGNLSKGIDKYYKALKR